MFYISAGVFLMPHFYNPSPSFFKTRMVLWQPDSKLQGKARTNILENEISNIMTAAGFEYSIYGEKRILVKGECSSYDDSLTPERMEIPELRFSQCMQ